jgi:hypothetical protein
LDRRGETLKIKSPLAPDECLRRIEDRFDGPLGRSALLVPGGRLLGRVEGHTFEVLFTGPPHPILAGGYPRLVFVGRVTGFQDGSVLEAGIGHSHPRTLVAIWCGLLALLSLLLCLYAASHVLQNPIVAFAPLLPVGILGIGRMRWATASARRNDVTADVAIILAKAVAGKPVRCGIT